MFHVERDERVGDHGVASKVGPSTPPPTSASTVFGDRLPLAVSYHRMLATDGIVRGLIGPREVPRLWDRHLINCAVVADLIDNDATVVDIGSGAGLPGIPLAIARPDLSVTLIEPLLRRTTFLEEVVTDLGIDVRVVRGRADDRNVLSAVPPADVVTSRAVAPLDRLVKWSAPFIRPGGHLVAIKGSSAADEIARDGRRVESLGVSNLRVDTCGDAVLGTPTTVIVGVRQLGSASGPKGGGSRRRK